MLFNSFKISFSCNNSLVDLESLKIFNSSIFFASSNFITFSASSSFMVSAMSFSSSSSVKRRPIDSLLLFEPSMGKSTPFYYYDITWIGSESLTGFLMQDCTLSLVILWLSSTIGIFIVYHEYVDKISLIVCQNNY